jgi:FlaA1/EpsC-like NDP-sugar epimerase
MTNLNTSRLLENKRVLITGGTGSLGQILVRRLLASELGRPAQIVVFSRDEAKQYAMRSSYLQLKTSSERVIYDNYRELLTFRVGDVRDYASISLALRDVDVVFNAAALKQVPTCEYFPYQAVLTNIVGAENIVQAIGANRLPVSTVVGVSTDKACKPVNVMGMTKAVQERIFAQANLSTPNTRFVCVRYGNVLASRGSVIPLFRDQIRHGGPVTITSAEMTRFLLDLNRAVDAIFAALADARPGEIYVPHVPSARVVDIADVLIGNRRIEKVITGVRPGEKLHEILLSEEESGRTVRRDNHYVIQSIIPEIRAGTDKVLPLQGEYSSADHLCDIDSLRALLDRERLLMDVPDPADGELLR